LAIKHSEHEARPRPGIVYRCHICRLELIFDPYVKRVLAPLSERT
jgi:hypothetical protein